MISIILYSVGIMYTPGPVNILSLNFCLQNNIIKIIPFCFGVGISLFCWFLSIGYTGSAIVDESIIPYISFIGVIYTAYIAKKVIFSTFDININNTKKNHLNFFDGLMMQLVNPKSFLAVLPVVLIQFPSLEITGYKIAMWAFSLGLLGLCAPLMYAVIGRMLATRIKNARILSYFNVIMGLMLLAVAIDMFYSNVYAQLRELLTFIFLS